MESVSLKNTPDFDELRAEYQKIDFEMKRKEMPVAREISHVSTGLFEELKNLAIGIMAREEKVWEPPNIDLEKRILRLAKKPELTEHSKSWDDILKRMEHAERRVSIFLLEREAAMTHISSLKGRERHEKNQILRQYEKLSVSEKVLREESAIFIEQAGQLLRHMDFLKGKFIPVPSKSDK
jgi:hypothetical protein